MDVVVIYSVRLWSLGMSKGDRPRNLGKGFEEGYDKIFGKKCRMNHKHGKECEGYEEEKGVQ